MKPNCLDLESPILLCLLAHQIAPAIAIASTTHPSLFVLCVELVPNNTGLVRFDLSISIGPQVHKELKSLSLSISVHMQLSTVDMRPGAVMLQYS